ncbi:MAG: glycosyltransferase family 39 protein [Armatimonas sp.]
MLPRLLACLIAALALSFGFAFSLPQDGPNLNPRFRGLNPDENDHVTYAQKIRETGGLVRFPAAEIRAARATGQPEGDDLRTYAETHQPPLYYISGALLGGSLTALRVLSALVGLATVALAFRAARDVLPEFPEASWGAAGLMACLPAFAQLSGAANNDPLTTLFCTGIFWRLGLLVRRGMSFRDACILAAWIGAGLWTKLTVLQLFPLVVIAAWLGRNASTEPPTTGGQGGNLEVQGGVLAALRRRKNAKGNVFVLAALALVLALLLALPWLVRNQLLYGDPFNLSIFPLTAPAGTPTPQFMQSIPQLGLTSGTYLWLVAYRSLATVFYLLPPNQLCDRPGQRCSWPRLCWPGW